MTRTYSQKPSEVTRAWYHIDVSGKVLGRVASEAARLLVGKGKPTYTPHVDGGDYVVITNASKVVLTGRKLEEQKYRHSGYPGGIKSVKKAVLRSKDPIKLVTDAVKGMLPKNKLLSSRLKRLKVYSGEQHAQGERQLIKVEL